MLEAEDIRQYQDERYSTVQLYAIDLVIPFTGCYDGQSIQLKISCMCTVIYRSHSRYSSTY